MTSWQAIKAYLKQKYKFTYTHNQLHDQLSSATQKPDENIGAYADRIRRLIWKIKEVGLSEGEEIDFLNKMTELQAFNRFVNHSLPEISKFLRLKGVKTFDKAVLEAVEEDRIAKFSYSTKKYCSHCKTATHNTVDCRKKSSNSQNSSNSSNSSKICAYCKIPGHHITECRKRAAANEYKQRASSNASSQKASPNPTVQAISCNYCKKPGHVVNDCYRLQNKAKNASEPITCNFCHKAGHKEKDCRTKKNRNPENGSDFSKSMGMLSKNPIQRTKYFVQLTSPFLIKGKLSFLVDTGAEVSVLPIEDLKFETVTNLLTSDKPEILSSLSGTVTCLGIMYIPFILGDEKYNMKFHIVRREDMGSLNRGILGANILKAADVAIHSNSMILDFTKINLQLAMTSNPDVEISSEIPKKPVLDLTIQKTNSVSESFSEVSEIIEEKIETESSQVEDDTLEKKVQILPFNSDKRSHHVLSALRLEHLNPENKEKLQSLIIEFAHDFFLKSDPLPSLQSKFQHEIHTTTDVPIFVKNYRFPFIHKPEVEKQTQTFLKMGIIKPSNSPYNAPIWIVPKKLDASGEMKWRMVVDYRKLNEITIDDRYPMPNIEDILDNIGEAKIFSTLDLANGFHQIPVRFIDQPKTAFSTHEGHYEFTRMPFGLKNAPATFQRIINTVFSDFFNKFCFVYLDDIVVFSTTLQDHLAHLRKIFVRIHENNLQIQPDKSEFLQEHILYLGHVISARGIQPNPDKTKVLHSYPAPCNVKEVQRFLGMTGYYRRFIPNYAHLTKSLTQLLRKNEPFIWEKSQQDCFHELIAILTSDPLLHHPNFAETFYLYTDASMYVIGSVLQQKDIQGCLRPIAYASRTLNKAEINYSTIEKETLSIIWSVKHFRPYLYGQKFEILSDHKPLIWLMKANDPGSRLLRWRLYLEEYDYTISYIPGTKNVVADTLSRIRQISALTRAQTKLATEANESPSQSEHVQPHEPFLQIDITKAINIIIFTTPDTITESPFTREFHINGVKDEIIRHRAHQKTFFIVFYKQSLSETFSLKNFSILCNSLNSVKHYGTSL